MSKPIVAISLFTAAIVIACAPIANAQTYAIGSDARPRVQTVPSGQKIFTDGFSDSTGALIERARHFGYELGQTPGNPFFTADPGFNAVVGSGLPAGQQLRFEVAYHLRRWNGAAGPVSFKAATDNSLRLSFGASNVSITASSIASPGFTIGSIGSAGSIHRHLNATLLNSDGGTPLPGLYFSAIRLSSLSTTGGTIQRSDALYIAYNTGLSQTDFNRGMAYLASPRPGDANFDNEVDFADLVLLARNFNLGPDLSVFDGDFDGDGTVAFPDLVLLARNFNIPPSLLGDAGLAAGVAGGDGSNFVSELSRAAGVATVPEPTSMGLIAAIAVLTLRRKRNVSPSH